MDDADRAESVLSTMARAIEPTKTGLIAHVTESAVEVVDSEMGRLGGEVVRRPVVDVEAEIAAAEDAARAAEEEAQRKLGEERKAERKEKVQEKVESLKQTERLRMPLPGTPAEHPMTTPRDGTDTTEELPDLRGAHRRSLLSEWPQTVAEVKNSSAQLIVNPSAGGAAGFPIG